MAEKRSRYELILSAVDKFSAPFRRVQQGIDSAQGSLNRFRKSSETLSRDLGFARAGRQAREFAGHVGRARKEMTALYSTLTGFGSKLSLLLGVAGGGIYAVGSAAADKANRYALAAQKSGVSYRSFQEYAYAASLQGVGDDQMGRGLEELNKKSLDAALGDSASAGAFQMAGINIKNAKGELKTADTLFMEAADKIKALSEAGEDMKAAYLAVKLFGESGKELLPVLKQGSSALAGYRQEAHELGQVFDEEGRAGAARFREAVARLRGAVGGLANTVGQALWPVVIKLADALREWLGENRELISSRVKEWAERFAAALPGIIKAVKGIGAALVNVFGHLNKFAAMVGGWERLIVGVAVVMGGKLLIAIALATKAFIGMGLALMTTPLGPILALAGAAYAIYRTWSGITGYFKGIFKDVKDAFSRNWVEGVVKVIDMFNPLIPIKNALVAVVKYFTGIDLSMVGEQLIESIRRGAARKWEEFKAWLEEKWNSVKKYIPFLDDDDEPYPQPSRPAMAQTHGSRYSAPANPMQHAPAADLSRLRMTSTHQVNENIERSISQVHLVLDPALKASGDAGPDVVITPGMGPQTARSF